MSERDPINTPAHRLGRALFRLEVVLETVVEMAEDTREGRSSAEVMAKGLDRLAQSVRETLERTG